MALTDIEKTFLFNYSQQLMQQDILTNQLFAGSSLGKDLRSLVLGDTTKATIFTNPFEDAISGTLRADADGVRQASKNVGEAVALMDFASNGIETITDSLDEMQSILDKVKTGELDGTSAVVQSDYESLKDKIIGVYENTEYNGIYMMDSSRWGTDQIDLNGDVYIQSSANGGFNVTFHDVSAGSGTTAWSDLQGSDLANSAGQTTQEAALLDLQSFAGIVEDLYESKVESLESQQTSLESQAQILDKAAQLRKPSDPNYSLEKLLADLVNQQLGTIVDSSG